MIAVFGPKSLYSGLEMCSLPSLALNEANIIQDTRTTYPAISTQSAQFEPFGCGKYKVPAEGLSVSSCRVLLSLAFRQDSTTMATTKNKALPHNRGCFARAKSNPAR